MFTPRLLTHGLPLLLAIAIVRPGLSEPMGFELQWRAGEAVTFAERWTGSGRLFRGAGDDALEVPLDGEGSGHRRWHVDEAGAEEAALTQATAGCLATLSLPDGKYVDERLWRAFELVVRPGGRIVRSTVIDIADDDEPQDEDEDAAAIDERFSTLPFDLDLGELFCILELGLLPPKALEVGEPWSAEATRAGGLSANGRLLELENGDAGLVAKLETRYACPVPERATPVPDVVATGTLTGRALVLFEVAAGRVKQASGPLELRLEFRRKGTAETIGRVELDLELETVRQSD